MQENLGSTPEMTADPVSLKVEGDMLFQQADISGALRLWREALTLAEEKVGKSNDNLQHTLRMNLVRGHTRRTEWSSVLEWCNAAIAVGSKDNKAYHWKAIALGRRSEWEEAEVALQGYLANGGEANIAERTRKEWERSRKAKLERESSGNNDGTVGWLVGPDGTVSTVSDGLRQRSVAVTQKTTDGSTHADSSSGSRKLMGGSGKSLTAGYISASPADGRSGEKGGRFSTRDLLYQLCPLNWDRRTYQLISIISTASWLVGLGFGWCLRRELFNANALNSTEVTS